LQFILPANFLFGFQIAILTRLADLAPIGHHLLTKVTPDDSQFGARNPSSILQISSGLFFVSMLVSLRLDKK
jgi:hypothetical protein